MVLSKTTEAFLSLSCSAVHSASTSGSSANAAASLVEGSADGPSLSSSISYNRDELNLELTEFTSLNSYSFSDANICRSVRTSVYYNNSDVTKK